MAQQIAADGGNGTERPIDKVETITIDFEEFKTALEHNYLTDTDRRRGGNTVLRLYPEFEAEMEAEKYFSEQGRHYDSNWNEQPVHIRPHLLLEESDCDFFRWQEYPTVANQRGVLTEEEIEDAGGIDAVVEEAREWFWDELKHSLPDESDIGSTVAGYTSHTVELEWVNVE